MTGAAETDVLFLTSYTANAQGAAEAEAFEAEE